MDPVKKSERSGWGEGARGAQAARRAAREPKIDEWCEQCGESGCPYCAGPEADYHTQCIPCDACGRKY